MLTLEEYVRAIEWFESIEDEPFVQRIANELANARIMRHKLEDLLWHSNCSTSLETLDLVSAIRAIL